MASSTRSASPTTGAWRPRTAPPRPAGSPRTARGRRPGAGSRRARARRPGADRTTPRPRGARAGRTAAAVSRIAPRTTSSSPYIKVRSVPNDQPTSHTFGRSWNSAYSIAAATSKRSPTPLSKAPRVPCCDQVPRLLKRRTPMPASAGSPEGGLAVDVAVHHAAVGGQRVQADEGGRRVAICRQRQLADQPEAVRRSRVSARYAEARRTEVGTDDLTHAATLAAVRRGSSAPLVRRPVESRSRRTTAWSAPYAAQVASKSRRRYSVISTWSPVVADVTAALVIAPALLGDREVVADRGPIELASSS